MTYSVLMLKVGGVLTPSGFAEPVQSISFINGDLSLIDDNGTPGWVPAIAPIKSGVWADPVATEGRRLQAAHANNVTETITATITAAGGPQRYAIISRLLDMARQARDFWQAPYQARPVYLEFVPFDGVGPQFAAVYTIEVDIDQDALYSPDPPRVTVTLEREPAWRAEVPPGMGAVRWANFVNGIDRPPQAGDAVRFTTTIYAHDERGTSNVNYIKINGEDIPGDAPALALITMKALSPTFPAVPYTVYVARSTRQNTLTANGVMVGPGVYNGLRARNTLNAGDSGTSGGVWTKTVDAANGLLSNGSIVTRYVQRHNSAAAATDHALLWNIQPAAWRGKYALFVRGWLAAGTTADVTLTPAVLDYAGQLKWRGDARRLVSTGYRTTYLGIVDFTLNSEGPRGFDGAVDSTYNAFLYLYLNKAAAVSVDMRIVDVVLMPIDECGGQLSLNDFSTYRDLPIVLDSTGQYSDRLEPMYVGRENKEPLPYRGTPITLMPNVDNWLYFMIEQRTQNPTHTWTVNVDIVPRWYGPRGE